jgi:hypothetical protein
VIENPAAADARPAPRSFLLAGLILGLCHAWSQFFHRQPCQKDGAFTCIVPLATVKVLEKPYQSAAPKFLTKGRQSAQPNLFTRHRHLSTLFRKFAWSITRNFIACANRFARFTNLSSTVKNTSTANWLAAHK